MLSSIHFFPFCLIFDVVNACSADVELIINMKYLCIQRHIIVAVIASSHHCANGGQTNVSQTCMSHYKNNTANIIIAIQRNTIRAI